MKGHFRRRLIYLSLFGAIFFTVSLLLFMTEDWEQLLDELLWAHISNLI